MAQGPFLRHGALARQPALLRSASAARQQKVGVSMLPTANRVPGAAPVIAWKVLSGPSPSSPGSRLGTTDQERPSKCSVKLSSAPSDSPVCPPAQTSAGDSAVTPASRLPSVPAFGVSVSDHVVPFQCSTYGRLKFCWLTLPS